MKVKITVPLKTITHAVIDALEFGSSYWLDRFELDQHSVVLARPWYATEALWEDPKLAIKVAFAGEGAVEHRRLGAADFAKGLQAMAKGSPRHFADLVGEGADGITSDVFLQYVVLGEVVFS